MTLEELADLYLTYNVLSKATADCYRSTISLFRKHLPPEIFADISVITLEHLLKTRKEILLYQKPISFNAHRTRLKALFTLAQKEGFLTVNPVTKLTTVAVPSKPFKTLSPEAIARILDYIRTKPDGESILWITITQAFYWTGMRRRQLAGLKWADVDFDASTILLRSENSKTRREWRIPMADELKKSLRLFRDWVTKLNKGVSPGQDIFVFDLSAFYDGAKKLQAIDLTNYYQLLGQKIGIQVSPHRFRHTIATVLANTQGINIKVIQEILGHSDIATTCSYILPSLSAMREAISSLPTNEMNNLEIEK